MCTAELDVVDAMAVGERQKWFDAPRRYAATVRLSGAVGSSRRLPDGLGPAVRMEQAAGPGRSLDLLLTSSGGGRGRVTRRLPRLPADAPGGPYSSPLSYRVGGRPCVLAAFPRRSGRAPVHGDPVGPRRAPASGPLVFDLCAGAPDGTWRAFAVLTVSSQPPLGQEESAQFDLHRHGVEGMTPGRTLAATRRAAYRGPRAGRRERGRS